MSLTLARAACLVALALVAARPAPAQEADLSPVDLDLVRPLVQSGRWVWMGDSFNTPSRLRVSFATLVTWPLDRIGGLALGPQSQMVRPLPVAPLPRVVSDANGFVLAPGTSTEARMGLPVFRMQEWDLPAGATPLGDLYVGFSLLADGYAARGGRAFDGPTTVRPLRYRRPGVADLGGVVYGGSTGTAEPPVGFSLGPGTTVVPTSDRRVTVSAAMDAPGVVHLAGSVVSARPGHYAQFLADGSWSYWGFGSDADPAPPDSVKRFRTGDLVSYLQATTLDPDQPAVAVVYLAQERREAAVLKETVARVLAQTREAFRLADLDEPVVLFVHPHAIDNGVVSTAEENERAGVAMREIALADPRVAFLSLYDATDGVVFDGRAEARDWLEGSRFDPLCYGGVGEDAALRLVDGLGANLLDPGRLHTTEPGALFFSALMGEIVTGEEVTCDGPIEPPPPRGPVLSPNPVVRGGRVVGADPRTPIYDVLGRRVGRTAPDGSFSAPRAAGVYLVGGGRLVVL